MTTNWKLAVEAYRDIISGTLSPQEIFDRFVTLTQTIDSGNLFAYALYFEEGTERVQFADISDITYDVSNNQFIINDTFAVPPEELILVIVPKSGFQSLPPYTGGDVKEYLRKSLLAIAPDLSPYVGDSISSAEEFSIDMLSAIASYLADQLVFITSQFFPESASDSYLVQLAAISGRYPSPPSPDVATLQLRLSEESTPVVNSWFESVAVEVVRGFAQSFLHPLFQYIQSELSRIDGTTYQVPEADISVFNSANALFSQAQTILNSWLSGSFEMVLDVPVSVPSFTLSGYFPEQTFPKPFYGAEKRVRFDVGGKLSIRIRFRPQNVQTSTVTVELLSASPVQSTYNLKYVVGGVAYDEDATGGEGLILEIVSVSYRLKFSSVTTVLGKGVKGLSQEVTVDGIKYLSLPPVDFRTIQADKKIVVNPFKPSASLSAESYMVPVWDPTTRSTILKIVTRRGTSLKFNLFYEQIQPITQSAYQLPFNVTQISGNAGYNVQYPSDLLYTFQQLSSLPSPFDISVPPTSISLSGSGSTLLSLSNNVNVPIVFVGEVISLERGYPGDTVPLLRVTDIPVSGVVNEDGIKTFLERNLPVLVSADIVAQNPTQPPELP